MPKQTNVKKNNKVEEIEEEIEEIEETEEIEVEEEENEEVEEVENKKKSKKIEYVSESIEESMEETDRIIDGMERLVKELKAVQKVAKKQYQKKSKSIKKRKENNPDMPKKAAGFIKAKFIPDKFKRFYEKHLKDDKTFTDKFPEFNIEVDQKQTDITKIIYNYIRTNDLYEKNEDGTSNKRAIKPDKSLIELFIIGEGETIGFNNFQTYIKRLYNSNEETDEQSDNEETHKVKSSKKSTSSKSSA
jgi:hypothetical protein